MILRVTQPERTRVFRTPLVWIVGPLAMAGCLLLFVSLGSYTIKLFFLWAIIGLLLYAVFGRKSSHLGKSQDADSLAAKSQG